LLDAITLSCAVRVAALKEGLFWQAEEGEGNGTPRRRALSHCGESEKLDLCNGRQVYDLKELTTNAQMQYSQVAFEQVLNFP